MPDPYPHTGGDAPPLFDADGLFIGALGRTAWPALLRRVEETLDSEGWDQPARLYGLVNPVNTEAVLGAQARHIVTEIAGRPDTDGRVTTSCALTELGALDGHPAEALWGQTLPGWVAAAVIAFEGWSPPKRVLEATSTDPDADPYAHLRNSQRPDRVEIRCVHMLTRSGATHAVIRTRGGDVDDLDSTGGGYLIDVLARTLGAATGPAPDRAGADYLGRLALNTATELVATLTHDPKPDDETRPSLRTDEARAAVGQLGGAQRAGVLASLFNRTLLAAVAHLTWTVTNHGKGPVVDIELPLRRLVRDAAHHGAHEAQHFDAVTRTARRCATLTLTDLAATRRARSLVPPDIADNPYWADEGLLYRRLCLRQLPTQDTLLDVATRLCGTGLDAAAELLDVVDWRTPDTPGT